MIADPDIRKLPFGELVKDGLTPGIGHHVDYAMWGQKIVQKRYTKIVELAGVMTMLEKMRSRGHVDGPCRLPIADIHGPFMCVPKTVDGKIDPAGRGVYDMTCKKALGGFMINGFIHHKRNARTR